jgi:hypothetical protein
VIIPPENESGYSGSSHTTPKPESANDRISITLKQGASNSQLKRSGGSGWRRKICMDNVKILIHKK